VTQPVSILIPALADQRLLAAHLPPLLVELAARDAGDEVVVIDDTGENVLSSWMQGTFPAVRVIASSENRGFASALAAGAREAQHAVCFSMNPDVLVHPGFLGPLVRRLADPGVFAVSPRILLDGDITRVESRSALRVIDGLLRVVPCAPESEDASPIAFAVGGASLFRRDEFLAAGFDRLLEPFYWEDVDLCLAAWRRGLVVVEEPLAVVEHHHRGTIGAHVPESLVRAAIEKNRRLVLWKYLDDPETARDHLTATWRDLFDAGLADRREELTWLVLALEDLPRLAASRDALAAGGRRLEDILRLSDPAS